MKIAMLYYAEVDTNAHGKLDREVMRALAGEHDITVFSNSFDNPAPDRIAYVRVPLPPRPQFLVFAVFHVLAPIALLLHGVRRRERFDVIHFHDVDFAFGDVAYVHFCNRAFLARRGAPRPRSARQLARWLEHRLRAVFEPFIWRRAPRLVVPSVGVEREIRAVCGEDIGRRITVIPNAVPVDGLRRPDDFDRRAARATLGFGDEHVVAVFVSLGHYERKGLPLLLDAMALVRDTDLRLLVVGGTDGALAGVRARVDELDLSDRVVMLETQPDVRPYLWAADLFAFPSLYEAMPLGVCEAAGAGLPLLTTRVNGVVDFLEDGVSGWYVDRDARSIAAQLRRCVDGRDDLPAVGARAAKAVAEYTPEVFASRWRAFYGAGAEVA